MITKNDQTKAIVKVAIKYSKEQFVSLTLCTNSFSEDGNCASTAMTTYYEAPLDQLQECLDAMLPWVVAIARLSEGDWQQYGQVTSVTIKREGGMEIAGYCATAQLRHPDDNGAVQCVSTRFVPYEEMGKAEADLYAISEACLNYIAGNRKVSQLSLLDKFDEATNAAQNVVPLRPAHAHPR